MDQNRLIVAKADTSRADRHSCSLLKYGYIGLRFVRYQCSPWFVLAIMPLMLLFAAGVERTYVQIRYFSAIARIDFVGVYGLLNDLLW